MRSRAPKSEGGRRGAGVLGELGRVIASGDLDAYADLYAEDAVLEEVSGLAPPAHPLVAHGRAAIRQRYEDELRKDPISGWARQVEESALLDALETEDALAFVERRRYAAGDVVLAFHVARKKDGRIAHDRVAVVWDPGT